MDRVVSPLLVVGAGRGGTSLLTACLNGHARIHMASEFHTTRVLIGDDFPIRSTASLVDDRLFAFRALCDEHATAHAGKIWGNKITTEQLAGLEEHNALNSPGVDVAERFLTIMSGYRIVFITRHGASCVDSKVRRTGQPFTRAAIRWCYSARLLERLTDLGGVTARCRYEDLISDPAATLIRLCGSLGLAFDEGMLAQTGSDILGPEYRHGRFLSEKAENLPELAPEIEAMIEPWLARLGYAPRAGDRVR